MVVQIHIAVNQLFNCIKCTLKTISGMLFNAYFYKLCNVYNLSCMTNRKFRHYSIIIQLLAIPVFMTSCSDQMEQSHEGNRISFTTDIQDTWVSFDADEGRGTTRSTVSTLHSEGTKPFYLHTLYTDSIVSAFLPDSGLSARSAPVATSNMYDVFSISAYAYTGSWNNTQTSSYMYDVSVSKTGSLWVPASIHYWPGSAYKLKFFAYAPQNNSAYRLSGQTAGTPTIACTVPDNVAEQQDLLVAASGEVSGGTNTAVNLTFHHALTAVKFVCGSDMKAGTVKSVTLKGVNSAGVYNLETGTWSNVGNPKNFSQTLNRSTSGALNAVITAPEQTFMMIPQTLPDGAVIEVIFNDGITDNILTGQIGNSEWQKGKTVTYQLSSTSINWRYTLAVSSGNLSFNYLGGTQTYSVTSYRKNNQGVTEPVEWSTQYSVDNGVTWTDAKPDWLTQFTASGTGSEEAVPFEVTAAVQTGVSQSTHTAALRATAEKGSKALPYNLSNSTGGKAVENTANCYVVNAPGTYSLPLVYGNAIKNGQTNQVAYTSKASIRGALSPFINHLGNGITDPYIANNAGCIPAKAELVWQDGPSLVTDIKYNSGANGGTISFTVGKESIRQGNALIAIKDSQNTILWSWHIWVTDEDVFRTVRVTNHQNVSYELMPVQLGWCEKEVVSYAPRSCRIRFSAHGQTRVITINQTAATTSTRGNCTFYEWGRKDPLRPASGYGSNNKTWYNAEGIASTASHGVESFPFGNECIKNYIRKPDVMQKELWGDNAYVNLWNADSDAYGNNNTYNDTPVIKTVYDPCPAGFSLPPSNAFTGFTTTGKNVTNNAAEYNGEWDSSQLGWNFYCGPNKTGGMIFFPITGERLASGGNVSATGMLGHTWSAASVGSRYSHNLTLHTNYRVLPLDNFSRSAGHGVRPCKE